MVILLVAAIRFFFLSLQVEWFFTLFYGEGVKGGGGGIGVRGGTKIR
jgi:hypothetical protein